MVLYIYITFTDYIIYTIYCSRYCKVLPTFMHSSNDRCIQ